MFSHYRPLEGGSNPCSTERREPLEELSRRGILIAYFGGKHLLQMVCSMCLKDKWQVVGGARAVVMCEMARKPEPPALWSRDGGLGCEAKERKWVW
jgi:hypothetical protein